MIINCEACGKTYRINPEMLKDDQTVTTCKVCSHQIIVTRPEASASAEGDPFEMLEGLSEINPSDPVDSSEDPFDILDDFSPFQPSEQESPSDGKPSVSDGSDRAASTAQVSPQATSPGGSGQSSKGWTGLQSRLTLWMVLVALVPLVMFTAFAYQLTSTRLHAHVAALGDRATTNLAYQVNGWMEQNFRLLKTISHTPDIISMKWRKKAPLLKAARKEYPWIYQIVTLDLEKNNVGDVGNPVQIDFSNCACVNAVKGGKPEAWDTMIDPTSGKTVLVMAVPVTAAPGQIDGILAGLMDLDDLTHQIARWKQGKNGFAFLVDETGKRIIYTGEGNSERQSEDPDALPLIKAFHKGQTGPIFFKDSHGVASIGQVIRTASGWEVATQMQKAEALAGLNQAKTQYMFLLAAALIVGLLMALILGGLYTRPIRDLIGTANRISMGELTLTASTNRKDELADMAQAVTRMQESIRISVERMSRQRKSS